MIGARTLKKKGTNCPNCGGPVEFRSGGTMVAVCEFCHSAIARGDREVELIGKVSDLVETDSVVRLGSTGKYRGKPFECIGRVQYQHAAGGYWDEWYLRLPGDRIAWLADAQGQLQLTFPRRIDRRISVPDFNAINLGDSISLGDTDLTVMEKGTATASTAQGEIPWEFRPGDDHVYVDLRGQDNWFATIEYDAPQKPDGKRSLAVGKTVSLADLHLDAPAVEPLAADSIRRVQAVQLNCPQCGGPLDLRTPDQTMRVGCPNCGALLDVNDGKLRVLKTLDDRLVKPSIPLGSVGRFQCRDKVSDHEFTLIGCMDRYAMYQGTAYPWREYLLHNPKIGFRWLVENDRHWSFVEPVTDGDFNHHFEYHQSLQYSGRSYRLYDRGRAYVRSCMGEFYWRVNQGDVVSTSDYISPPYMLSFETSKSGKTEELNISHGVYLTVDEVKAAFQLENLTRPWGVGPIQPSPAIHIGVWLAWVAFMAFITVMHVLGGVWFHAPGQAGPDPWMWFYAMIFVSVVPLGIGAYKYHFETQRWKDSDYSPYPTVET
ncbi:DUF4178 domain-containing protein [Allorhodopirellula heiligendammensis]|uniref:DUF4178 domain-containing protein n=1 Tax=Allorhodopirellula heiligendammensis TaxID=2714739 RepID=A0A5C6BUA7_9BACT|nr:DUF4178 domain-containing protein [Allorhodopirellula heiligendammensis]TWU15833.1 hypothetical protein Poly21_30350 [Allorhodopirellula heiligendammensis]